MTGQEQIYTGSILEHLLIQQLTAFYEVGRTQYLPAPGSRLE